jgi:hypothetical protein
MTNNTPDLLPCPFNHKHELERYITGDGTMVSCCSCGIEMHVDQWNTRALPAVDAGELEAWVSELSDFLYRIAQWGNQDGLEAECLGQGLPAIRAHLESVRGKRCYLPRHDRAVCGEKK